MLLLTEVTLEGAVTLAVILTATFLTATLSAVAGFGGGVLLLPVFVTAFGARDAIAVLSVVQLASNSSRVYFNRHVVDGHLVKLFALGAVPASVVGALVMTAAPRDLLVRVIGAFLLGLVIWRRLRPQARPINDSWFPFLGASAGFGSALLGSVGPLVAPFFMARNLVGGAYIGTEAAAAVVTHFTKLLVFGGTAVLTVTSIGYGLALVPASAAGAFAGRHVVSRLPAAVFTVLVEAGLLVAGGLLLVEGV